MNEKIFSMQDLLDFFTELNNCPGGESYLFFNDIEYYTDIGYAFSGIYMFLDAFSKKNAIKLPKDFYKKYNICKPLTKGRKYGNESI